MTLPHMEISLIPGVGIAIASHRADRAVPLIVDVDFPTIFQSGPEMAEKKIGNLVLNILKTWHPDELSPYMP